MRCSMVRDRIPAYVAGALEAKEHRKVESHLGGCLRCAREAQEGQETIALLARSLPGVEPPPQLWDRLSQRIRVEGGHPFQRPARAQPWRWPWGWGQPILAGASALVLLALVGLIALLYSRMGAQDTRNQGLTQRIEEQGIQTKLLARTVANQRAMSYMLALPEVKVTMVKGTADSPRTYGLLLHLPDENVAMLVVTGLGKLPPSQAYQVWLVREGGRDSGGVFQPDEAGWAQLVVRPPQPIVSYQRIGVTIEPLSGSPAPTGPKVAGADMPPSP
ncbi:MAG: anti-sigma factor [Chloroflexi bacterium]|nr:anti-sigma factor [Chloroflexota bacterium]